MVVEIDRVKKWPGKRGGDGRGKPRAEGLFTKALN
jgi:hypothetical protein